VGDGIVGKVKGSKGKEYHVKWEGAQVQVKEISGLWTAGWQSVGRALSAGEAMRMAEGYVYNR
jgi:hypothetical protein